MIACRVIVPLSRLINRSSKVLVVEDAHLLPSPSIRARNKMSKLSSTTPMRLYGCLLPFAAVPETGGEIDGFNDNFKLVHQLMLNLLPISPAAITAQISSLPKVRKEQNTRRSMLPRRAVLRARSAVQCFPDVEWRQRMDGFHKRSVNTSRAGRC